MNQVSYLMVTPMSAPQKRRVTQVANLTGCVCIPASNFPLQNEDSGELRQAWSINPLSLKGT